MSRGRLVLSFLLFIALCASIAYWGLQLYDPPLRPVAPSAQAQTVAPRMEAAAAVFGGQATTEVASNFQLRGVIYSGTPRDSVAIIAIEGKPPQAYRANAEVAPGVRVQEVHRQYVLLSDGGAMKRIELPAAARDGQINGIARSAPPVATSAVTNDAATRPAPTQAPAQTAPAQGTTVVTPAQEQAPEQEQVQQDDGVAQTGETDAAAASSQGDAAGEEAAEAPEQIDPAQTQANPPRRQ